MINLTKMSQNGQVVIPAAIRKDLKPKTQFLVVKKGMDIILRQVSEEEILHELELMERIDEADREIAKGNYVKADTSMSFKEFDDLLMS